MDFMYLFSSLLLNLNVQCFYPEEGIVRNQIQARPWYTFNLIDPIVLERFEAQVYVGESMHNTTEEAIIIDYSETPRQFGKSFRCYQDEIREVSPGFFLGRLYAKPFSYCDRLNPLPYPFFVLHFALFQAPIMRDEDMEVAVQGYSGNF